MSILFKKSFSNVPSTLSFYGGGLYIGNFYPGPPISSESSILFGNKNTGNPIEYTTYAEGSGDKENFWAIIICPVDYESSMMSFTQETESPSTFDTSHYDGLYNRTENSFFNSNLRRIVEYGGFTDWYIPSVDELAFICKNLPIGYYIPRKFSAIERVPYRSSSISIRGITETTAEGLVTKRNGFYYAQSFDKTKYGRVYHVEEHSFNTKIRLIRRINLINYVSE